MPRNFFEGATLDASVVEKYYSNTNFDHFAFQQVLANPGASDNSYTLCVYAVLFQGAPLPYPLATVKMSPPTQAPAAVQYANMKLYASGLKALYPDGVNSGLAPITIVPTGPYMNNGVKTNYMAYNATTPYITDLTGGVPINPSPPA